MEYANFYDIAEYGNANWKGNFSPREIAINAYDYLCEFEISKKYHLPTLVIQELLKLLKEDGSEETKNWYDQILNEIKSKGDKSS